MDAKLRPSIILWKAAYSGTHQFSVTGVIKPDSLSPQITRLGLADPPRRLPWPDCAGGKETVHTPVPKRGAFGVNTLPRRVGVCGRVYKTVGKETRQSGAAGRNRHRPPQRRFRPIQCGQHSDVRILPIDCRCIPTPVKPGTTAYCSVPPCAYRNAGTCYQCQTLPVGSLVTSGQSHESRTTDPNRKTAGRLRLNPA
jgi:hypothetical protein